MNKVEKLMKELVRLRAKTREKGGQEYLGNWKSFQDNIFFKENVV